MRLIHHLILVLIYSAVSDGLLLERVIYSKASREVLTCAETLLQEYDTLRSILVYSYHDILIDQLAKVILKNGRVTNLAYNLESIKSPQEFVTIVIEYIADLRYYCQKMFYTTGFKPQGYYFIIYLGFENLESIFSIIWDYYITKVILLDRNNNMYTYHKYVDGCRKIRKVFLFNCRDIDMDVIRNNDVEIKSFHGCQIRVLALITPPFVINHLDELNPGIEVKMLNTAASYLNFSVVYVRHNYTDYGYSEDGNFSNMLGDLFSNKADLVMGGFPQFDLKNLFQSTVPYFNTQLKLFVPIALRAPGWMNIIHIYDTNFWPAHLISLAALFWLGKYTRSMDNITMVAVFFNSAYHFQRPRKWIAKYAIILSFAYAFISSNFVVSGLAPFFMIPSYRRQMKTMEDLYKSDLHYGGVPYAFLQAKQNKLISNWTNCYADDKCIERVITRRDLALVDNVETIKYRRLYAKNHRELVFALKDWQFNYFISMTTRKGHPLTDLLTKVIYSFEQAGLVEKWYRETIFKEPKEIETSYSPLPLEHLVLVFMVLGLGHGIASIIFMYELWKAKNLRKMVENA